MSPVFLDTNVPMCAAGGPHLLREGARRVILAAASGELDAVTDAEVLQEILYRYAHIGEQEKGVQVFDHFYRVMLGRVLPVEDVDVWRARQLAEEYPALNPRHLIHLAIMLRHEISEIITADRGFERVLGIRRIDPATRA